jgi:hypothetical protein
VKLCISLLRNSVFNCGETPYTSEYKKLRPNNKKEKKEKIAAVIAIFNNELSNTFYKNFVQL